MGTISLEPQPEVRWETNRRLADRFFRGALAVTAAWLYFLLTGRDGGAAFAGRVDVEAVARVAVGFTVMFVLWGWLWYGVKRLPLRKLVGLSREETDGVSSSSWCRSGPGWGRSFLPDLRDAVLSPRGTDDFTMASANALLCWGFGSLVY